MRLTINWSALEPHPLQYSPLLFDKVEARSPLTLAPLGRSVTS